MGKKEWLSRCYRIQDLSLVCLKRPIDLCLPVHSPPLLPVSLPFQQTPHTNSVTAVLPLTTQVPCKRNGIRLPATCPWAVCQIHLLPPCSGCDVTCVTRPPTVPQTLAPNLLLSFILCLSPFPGTSLGSHLGGVTQAANAA